MLIADCANNENSVTTMLLFLVNLNTINMKKISCFAVFLVFVFASFAPINDKGATVFSKDQMSFPGNAWHTSRTYVEVNEPLTFCNGDIVVFPELITEVTHHGVNNGNISLVKTTITLKGVGYSAITGEEYKISDRSMHISKYPITNGVTVINSISKGMVKGKQGSEDNFFIKLHQTIDADGNIISETMESRGECQ